MLADRDELESLQRDDRYTSGLAQALWVLAGSLCVLAADLAWSDQLGYAGAVAAFAVAWGIIGLRARAKVVPLLSALLVTTVYACVASSVLGGDGLAGLLLLPFLAAVLLAPGLARRQRMQFALALFALILALPWIFPSGTSIWPQLGWIRWLHLLAALGGTLALLAAASDLLAIDDQRIEQLSTQIETLTHSDRLTGLHNRSHLERQLTAELARARRGTQPLAIALIDVDNMGEINAEHGHAVGDAVLRIAATTLQRTLREYDQIGRWEGQRFLLIMPSTSLLAACSVCHRLRALIANAARVQGELVPSFTASFGVSAALPELEAEALLHHAQRALAMATSEGGDRIACFEGERPRLSEPAAMT